MSIHPILHKLIADPLIKFYKSQPAKEQRKLWAERTRSFYLTSFKPKIIHKDLTIPARSHILDARLYTPETYSDKIILFLHGGGWSLGSVDTYQLICDHLAHESQCQILSIDYRLAPEHKFPSALEDTIDSFHWLAEHAQILNADPKKIILAGDSAGGNLVAVLSHLIKNEEIQPIGQILWYPALDADYNYPSKEKYTDLMYMLDRNWLEWFYENYQRDESDRLNPQFSPMHFENFEKLPPAFILLPKLDPLYDESKLYTKKLKDANIDVTSFEHEHMVHGFLAYINVIPNALQAIKQTANWVSKL